MADGETTSSRPGLTDWLLHHHLAVTQRFDDVVRRAFAGLGGFTATYPWLVITISLLLVVGASFGIGRIEEDNRTEVVWVSPSETVDNRAFIEQVWGEDPDAQVILITAADGRSNVVTPAVMAEVLAIHDLVSTQVSASIDGRTVRYPELCLHVPLNVTTPPCATLSPLDIWKYNISAVQVPISLATEFSAVDVSGAPFSTDQVLGGVERDGFGQISQASALRLTYLVQSDDVDGQIAWERELVRQLEEVYTSPNALRLFPFAANSISFELERSVTGDAPLIVAAVLVMAVYVVFVMWRRDAVHSRVSVGMAGLLSVMMAVVAAFGVAGYLGVQATSIVIVLPFLQIGIGVDDMFVIVAALEDTKPEDAVVSRMRTALSNAGGSITITSLTSMLAFGVGSIFASFPAVRYFCVYAVLAVFFDYALQVTFFVACLALDTRRVTARRADCLCCVSVGSATATKSTGSAARGVYSKRFFSLLYIPYFLRVRGAKLATIAVFVATFGLGVYGATQVGNDFEISDIVPDDSYVLDFLDASDLYFDLGLLFQLVTKDADFRDELQRSQLRSLMEELAASEFDSHFAYNSEWVDSSVSPAFLSWLTQFDLWLNATGGPSSPSPAQFDALLPAFLISPMGRPFASDVRFDEEAGQRIRYTRQHGRHITSERTSSQAEAELLLGVKQITRDSPLESFTYALNYLYWEGFLSIVREAALNMTLAVLSVFIVALVFLVHPSTSVIVTAMVVMIDFDLLGYMRLMNISINSVSVVVLVMGVGLSIDYCAHIAHAFMEATGGRQERAEHAMLEMGSSVVNAALTSLLGLLPLSLSETKVFRIFFQMLAGIVVLSMLHGFVLMPAVLSLMGPRSAGELCRCDEQLFNKRSNQRVDIPASA